MVIDPKNSMMYFKNDCKPPLISDAKTIIDVKNNPMKTIGNTTPLSTLTRSFSNNEPGGFKHASVYDIF